MIEDLHGNRGDPTDAADPFVLDDLERLARIEVVHQDDLAARRGAGHHEGV
jgi:hypothetical protein